MGGGNKSEEKMEGRENDGEDEQEREDNVVGNNENKEGEGR